MATQGTWRARLEQSWPLLLAGASCVALGTVLLLDRSTRTIDHLSPAILFLAVGATGLLGGLASFMVGPEEGVEARAGHPEGVGKTSLDVGIRPSSTGPSASQWMGRPAPVIGTASPANLLARPAASSPPWSEEETAVEIAPSRPPDPDTSRPPSPWQGGRLLHLSEEGALRVYSVEDALGDLELVSQVIHAHRSREGKVNPEAKGTSTG